MSGKLSELQIALIRMLSEIAPALDQHKIEYYVAAGTLLGAIRHQGFIPWDDDIDLTMPRPIYEVFLKNADKIIPKPYILETFKTSDDYPYFFAKIYDPRTTLIEGKSQPLVRGIYIDVFPLDGISNETKEQKKLTRMIRKYLKIYRRFIANSGYTGPITKRSTHLLIAPIIKFIFPKTKLIKKINKITSKHSWDTSKYITNYFGSWKEKEIHEKEWYASRVKFSFNGVSVWAPGGYIQILTKLYGNYLKLPPIDKQVTHHNFSFLDLNKPYK